MIRTAHHTVHPVGPAHWVVVRRTFLGWTVEENHAGTFVPLAPPLAERDVAEVLADAYTATRLYLGETTR